MVWETRMIKAAAGRRIAASVVTTTVRSTCRRWGLTLIVLVIGTLMAGLGYASPPIIALPPPGAAAPPPVTTSARAPLDCTSTQTATNAPAPGTSHLIATLADNIIWQPRNGTFRFTITAPEAKSPSSLSNIEVAVCFGWPQVVFATADTNRTPKLYGGTYLRTIARTDDSITYETTLPDALWSKDNKQFAPTASDVFEDFFKGWAGKAIHVYDGWGIVPTIHMRIVARSQGPSDIENDPNALDTVLPVGISYRLLALFVTVIAIGVAWKALLVWADYRNVVGGPILRIVANRNGYASLSQFQILLWTVVIGAGLTYVMALSGSLIDVPDQVLAVLGISGFSALSAAYAGTRPKGDPPPQQPVETSAPKPRRTPKWSDLVVWDGTSEIDITRVQMLVFTVLAAAFVVIKMVDEDAIPVIPDGIVLLMGLTNGVYVGGKFVPSQDKTPETKAPVIAPPDPSSP
jgi:hypothetical protein